MKGGGAEQAGVRKMDVNEPDWRRLVRLSEPWRFEGGVLVHRDAASVPGDQSSNALKRLLVRHVFAAQKHSRSVKRELNRLLAEFPHTGWGLNFGAGGTQFHDRILNVDISQSPNTHVVMAGRELPFHDNSFDLVISQEVLEHVDDPWHWVGEIHRVLKPDGRFYCQIPFIIGYHPGPTDFWRLTREAYPVLFPKDTWTLDKVELALGTRVRVLPRPGRVPGRHGRRCASAALYARKRHFRHLLRPAAIVRPLDAVVRSETPNSRRIFLRGTEEEL